MSKEYTLPYDPFLLLERASNTHSYSENGQQILWRGAGVNGSLILDGNQGKPDVEDEVTNRTLYVSDNGVPIKMYIDVDNGDCHSLALKDGIGGSGDCAENNDYIDYSFYIETLSVTERALVSSIPIALINYKYSESGDGYEFDYSYSGPTYEPTVVFFKEGTAMGYQESSRESITDDNSDYYEGVFQFDINGDGQIPAYRPSSIETYTPKLVENGGKYIQAKKSDDETIGTGKNDEITGSNSNDSLLSKKGNDLLYGRKGDDYLSGGKGDDFLNGGHDDDILAGGKNSDVFKISKGIDTVTDFSLEQGDRIAIDADKFDQLEIDDSVPGALLSVSGLGQMLITGISANTMEENFEAIFVKYIAK